MNTTISQEAAQAVERLRHSGFKITSDTGSYRLIRSDGSQAANGHLGNVSNDPEAFNRAAINGLKRAHLKDEARRVSMTRPVFGKEGSWRPTIG
jgi:hypothetical protein